MGGYVGCGQGARVCGGIVRRLRRAAARGLVANGAPLGCGTGCSWGAGCSTPSRLAGPVQAKHSRQANQRACLTRPRSPVRMPASPRAPVPSPAPQPRWAWSRRPMQRRRLRSSRPTKLMSPPCYGMAAGPWCRPPVRPAPAWAASVAPWQPFSPPPPPLCALPPRAHAGYARDPRAPALPPVPPALKAAVPLSVLVQSWCPATWSRWRWAARFRPTLASSSCSPPPCASTRQASSVPALGRLCRRWGGCAGAGGIPGSH